MTALLSKRRITRCVLAAAVLAVVALCLELPLSGAAAPRAAHRATQTETALAALSHLLGKTRARSHIPARALLAHFAILRRASRRGHTAAADNLPAHFGDGVASLGLDPTAMATVTYGTTPVELIPGSVGSCLRAEFAGAFYSTCAANVGGSQPVSQDGLFQVMSVSTPSGSASQELAAMLPDGNTTVTLVHADGSSVSAPVIDNAVVVSLTSDNPVTELRFRATSGAPGVDQLP